MQASTFKAELTEVSTIDAKIKPAVPSRAKKGQAATEEIAAFRRRLGIRVRGDGCPDPIYSFEEMLFRDDPTGNRLKSSIISSIESSEWKEVVKVYLFIFICRLFLVLFCCMLLFRLRFMGIIQSELFTYAVKFDF